MLEHAVGKRGNASSPILLLHWYARRYTFLFTKGEAASAQIMVYEVEWMGDGDFQRKGICRVVGDTWKSWASNLIFSFEKIRNLLRKVPKH